MVKVKRPTPQMMNKKKMPIADMQTAGREPEDSESLADLQAAKQEPEADEQTAHEEPGPEVQLEQRKLTEKEPWASEPSGKVPNSGAPVPTQKLEGESEAKASLQVEESEEVNREEKVVRSNAKQALSELQHTFSPPQPVSQSEERVAATRVKPR